MGEKDCVALFVDLFKWGAVVLVAITGWMLHGNDVLDWPPPHTEDLKAYARSIIFLVFSGFFWGGWALVLDRIRERARSLSQEGGDFLGSVGLARVHWIFCGIAWAGAWYIVFDGSMGAKESLITLVTFAALLAGMVITQNRARAALPEP